MTWQELSGSSSEMKCSGIERGVSSGCCLQVVPVCAVANVLKVPVHSSESFLQKFRAVLNSTQSVCGQSALLNSAVRTRTGFLSLSAAPDGRLSKPFCLCTSHTRTKNINSVGITNEFYDVIVLLLRIVRFLILNAIREMALFMSVKKLRFYRRLEMNQLKCKSQLKCKWECAMFLIIAFP
jgi:hypothetical protein